MFEDLITELQAPARDLLSAAGEAGLQPRITSTRRTPTQQARLYRRWLSGLSPLPAARPGTSAHEFGFAFDMVVTPWEALADVGYTWQQWGGVWGAERDPVHFEYPGFSPPLTSRVETDILQAADMFVGKTSATIAEALYPEAGNIPGVRAAESPFQTFEAFFGYPLYITQALYKLFH